MYEVLTSQTRQHGEAIRKLAETSHENSIELKHGLDASEFNLRAHQKVINALGIELERIRSLLLALLPADECKVEMPPILEMADVTIPAEEGEEPLVVRRVNWPYYHEQVEKDLKILAEEEERRIREEEAAVKAATEEAAQEQAEDGAKEEAEEPLQDDTPEGAVVFGGS